MPVMEGKALLFKEFAGVDAFPLCLATKDTDSIVEFVGGGPSARLTWRTSRIIVCDIEGVLYAGRPGLARRMALAARTTPLENGAWPTTCCEARTCSSACRDRAR